MKKRLISALLSATLIAAATLAGVPLTNKTAYAATEKTKDNTTLGAGVLKDGVNTSAAKTVYYGNGREWRVIGYDGTGVAAASGCLTLFASDNLATTQFNPSNGNNHYKDSALQGTITGIYNDFQAKEKSAAVLKTRTLEGGSANYSTSDTEYDSNKIAGDAVSGAPLWPLSYWEASRDSGNMNYLNADLRPAYNEWWLRSPGDVSHDAAIVGSSGDVTPGGVAVELSFGARPAFYLNLSSIIFTSQISGKYKLTIKDSDMSAAVTTGESVSRSGNEITVPYTVSSSTNRVSVLITNGAFTPGMVTPPGIKFYQALNIEGGIGTSGTGTFTLPSTFDASTDKVYILAEKIIGDDKLTDYASTPVEITIPDAKPTLTITAKDKTYQYNGETRGPGDAAYTGDEVAEMVTVEGLQSGDTLTSITIDGQGQEVGDYDLTPYSAMVNNSSASNKYDVTYVKGKLHITSTGKSYNVTFKVKNGAWNDGTKADKTVTLSSNAGDTLKLSADQIPAVGSKPDTHYKEGSWDVTPDTETAITSDTTYIYTYANDGPQPDKCTITFEPNGGKGEMDPQTGNKGETIKLKANDFIRREYEFKNWNTKADGSGDKYDNKESIKLEKDLTLYAQWKEKHEDDDHEEEPAPKNDGRYPDGFDELRASLSSAISAAIASGKAQIVYWNKSTSLPADVMKILYDNPNVTLVFSYTYLGAPITLTIPGSAVVLNPAVEWYGPAYLYGLYGNGKTAALTTNTTVSARTYTVKSGDTLSDIAKRLHTTVKNLQEANNIKDADKIKPGMVLKY